MKQTENMKKPQGLDLCQTYSMILKKRDLATQKNCLRKRKARSHCESPRLTENFPVLMVRVIRKEK